MKISAKMKKALNDQVGLEANASSSYLAMASWCEVTGYEGAAGYFYAQSDEERTHMLKVVHYLNDMGAIATIPATKAPATSYKSLEVLQSCEMHLLSNFKSITDHAYKPLDKLHFTFLIC